MTELEIPIGINARVDLGDVEISGDGKHGESGDGELVDNNSNERMTVEEIESRVNDRIEAGRYFELDTGDNPPLVGTISVPLSENAEIRFDRLGESKFVLLSDYRGDKENGMLPRDAQRDVNKHTALLKSSSS